MRPGATIMSSFLFNVALILLATTACIQFCATAFSAYANGTAILNIYGDTLTNLQVRVYASQGSKPWYSCAFEMLLLCGLHGQLTSTASSSTGPVLALHKQRLHLCPPRLCGPHAALPYRAWA